MLASLLAPDLVRVAVLTALPFAVGWLGEQAWYRARRQGS